MKKEYSRENVTAIRKSPYPRVLLNACTHGNEKVGLRVLKHFKDVELLRGTLMLHIANKQAVSKNIRFVDHDLNRVFPGKRKGSHEEMLAYAMTPFIKAFDVVIDVHSTESGLTSSVIVTTLTPEARNLITAIAPKQVIHMVATESNALISNAKIGISFECGKDKSEQTYRETVRGITRSLEYLHMLPAHKKSSRGKTCPSLYEAFAILPKPEGYVVYSRIKNFKLIKKGEPIGYHPATKKRILAPRAFYPILFGKNSYKTVFGFMGKKKSL